MIRKQLLYPLGVIAVLAALLSLCPRAHAGPFEVDSTPFNPPAVSPNTPLAITALADGLHLGDNGSLLTLRDVQNGVWALGSSTALYKKFYFSADGLLGYIPNAPQTNAFYAANVRFWAGQFAYDQIPLVKSLADSTAATSALMQYGTVGYWGTRDFQYGVWRQGWDAGITTKFGYLTKTGS